MDDKEFQDGLKRGEELRIKTLATVASMLGKGAQRDDKRIDKILLKLETYWRNNPDMRLGQIFVILMSMEQINEHQLFYAEDDVLERAIDRLIEIQDAQEEIPFNQPYEN